MRRYQMLLIVHPFQVSTSNYSSQLCALSLPYLAEWSVFYYFCNMHFCARTRHVDGASSMWSDTYELQEHTTMNAKSTPSIRAVSAPRAHIRAFLLNGYVILLHASTAHSGVNPRSISALRLFAVAYIIIIIFSRRCVWICELYIQCHWI